MKAIYYLCLILLLASCSDSSKNEVVPEPDYIKIDLTEIAVDDQASTKRIEFSTSKPWRASLAAGTNTWCSIKPNQGNAGKGFIDVTVQANDTYDERNTAVRIQAASLEKSVTVTQKQKDAIIVESNKAEIDHKGGEVSFNVKSNISYTYEIDKSLSWIHQEGSKSRALSSKKLTFMVDPNDTTATREGTILLKGNNLEEKITIYQSGEEARTVISKTEYTVPSAGETIKVEIKSNSKYDYKLPEVDWITESKSRAMSAFTHYFEVKANTSYDSREASITFTNKLSGKSETVKITQMQKDALILSKSEYTLPADANTLHLTVSTNVKFKVGIDAKWIQQIETKSTRGLEEKALDFKIAANPSKTPRTGAITFTAGNITQKVKITQNGQVEMMNISLVHHEPIFILPEFIGTITSGTIQWGDGTTDNLTKVTKHEYTSAEDRTTIIQSVGPKGFKIKTIGSISSITISYNEPTN